MLNWKMSFNFPGAGQIGNKWQLDRIQMGSGKYNIDLIRQMAECDANYIRLIKLIPGLGQYRNNRNLAGKLAEFYVAGGENKNHRITVEIRLLEAFKYTTTLELSQWPAYTGWFEGPIIQVRVYHDACTCEVVSYQGHRNLEPVYPQPNPHMYTRDEKLQVNRFLGEWLSHCLATGRSIKVPHIAFST